MTLRFSGRQDLRREVVRAMLDWMPPPTPGEVKRVAVGSDQYAKHARLPRLSPQETTNSFLFAVIFDHMIRADRAWAAPSELARRLGHLDVHLIARMSEATLGPVVRGRGGEKALHRLWPRVTRNLIAASQHLIDRYEADAENIWPDGLDVSELKRRLHEVPGLGSKLVNMTVRLLSDDFGRRFRGWENADVAVDRHVARVFLRTGLVGHELGGRTHRLHQLRDEITDAARRLSPKYPAALDGPAFYIGQGWCKARGAECRGCPLLRSCDRKRKSWTVG
ncbi:MAG: hypothetical protein IPM35_16585 [Myxococcales bacterium]|nr:hypothetical protein [Myxococcales bacterium]